jgi:hypothetical protein
VSKSREAVACCGEAALHRSRIFLRPASLRGCFFSKLCGLSIGYETHLVALQGRALQVSERDRIGVNIFGPGYRKGASVTADCASRKGIFHGCGSRQLVNSWDRGCVYDPNPRRRAISRTQQRRRFLSLDAHRRNDHTIRDEICLNLPWSWATQERKTLVSACGLANNFFKEKERHTLGL